MIDITVALIIPGSVCPFPLLKMKVPSKHQLALLSLHTVPTPPGQVMSGERARERERERDLNDYHFTKCYTVPPHLTNRLKWWRWVLVATQVGQRPCNVSQKHDLWEFIV